MKVAFAIWNNRIAPVFDVARLLHIVEAENSVINGSVEEILPIDLLPIKKAERLSELGVKTLICGAISRPLYDTIVANGIDVIPFIAGELDEVVQAWLSGRPDWHHFAMPGCCGRRGRWQGGFHTNYQEMFIMSAIRVNSTFLIIWLLICNANFYLNYEKTKCCSRDSFN